MRQEKLFCSMTPKEKKMFLQFCQGKRRRNWLDSSMENNAFVLCLQEQDIALYAEWYDRSSSLFRKQNGVLLQVISRSILKKLNDRYDKVSTLTMALIQHKESQNTGADLMMLCNVPSVVRYLLATEEQFYEGDRVSGHNDRLPLRRAYQKDVNGFLVEEALDLQNILLFLEKELPSTPLFDGIQICIERAIQDSPHVRVGCKLSSFMYIFVLLTYFIGVVSSQCASYITMETELSHVRFCVSCDLCREVHSLETENDLAPLIKQFPLGCSFLLLLAYLLKQNHIAYSCQITETEAKTQHLAYYLYLPTVPPEELVFRHGNDFDALDHFLPELEYFVSLLRGDENYRTRLDNTNPSTPGA